MDPDANNVYPRIGFAYRPLGNQNFVIRGGYGIYVVTDWQTGAYGNSLLQTGGPFGLSTQFDNAVVNGTPLLQWPLGYPPSGGTYRGIPSVSGINPHFVYPYNQQWNFTIERAIHGQGLRLSYIGNKDTKLGYTRDINKPIPSTTPFTPANYVNPNYVAVTYSDNGGGASYNSFETAFTMRGFAGFYGELGYAFAKQMSDVPYAYSEGVAGNSIQNPYCRACDRARSEIIPSHRFFAFYTWDLPFGHGRPIGKNMSAWVNALAGNWKLSTTIRTRTGLGLTPTYTGADPSNTNTFSGRPDVIRNPNLPSGQRSPDHWYDVSAFVVPPANAGRFGNAGRNLVDGPGAFRMDAGIFKFIPLKEQLRIVVSVTSNNVLNHPDYSWGRPPGSTNPINASNGGFLTNLYEDVGQREWSYTRFVFFNVGFEF
jgi:hypothetical protein